MAKVIHLRALMKTEGTAKCRPIIVLGAERSGTSVVAEMGHRGGTYIGESEKVRSESSRPAREIKDCGMGNAGLPHNALVQGCIMTGPLPREKSYTVLSRS